MYLINWSRIENTSHLVFSPCHYGLHYPDMGLTQICRCWLVIMSPEAGLSWIPLCSLADWNMWPFIIKNGLISIPEQWILTKHLSCQNPKLLLNFHCICGYICMIIPLLWSLAHNRYFWEMIRSTSSTIKILYILLCMAMLSLCKCKIKRKVQHLCLVFPIYLSSMQL